MQNGKNGKRNNCLQNDIINELKDWISLVLAKEDIVKIDNVEPRVLFVRHINTIEIINDLQRYLKYPELLDYYFDEKNVLKMINFIEETIQEKAPEDLKNKIIAMCL